MPPTPPLFTERTADTFLLFFRDIELSDQKGFSAQSARGAEWTRITRLSDCGTQAKKSVIYSGGAGLVQRKGFWANQLAKLN